VSTDNGRKRADDDVGQPEETLPPVPAACGLPRLIASISSAGSAPGRGAGKSGLSVSAFNLSALAFLAAVVSTNSRTHAAW